MPDRPFHITVVCTGNICRSPMGEVILRDLFDEAGLGDDVTVDSAGTTRWEVGNPMDPRAAAELRRRGYDGSAHVARQFEPDWLSSTDLLLAADAGHASVLRRWARTPADAAKVHLLREFDPAAVAAGTLEIDDPWYGDEEDFVRCFTEVEAACRGVAEWVTDQLAATPPP
ncbi:MAG TPA: low molecular weight protein-tyrosine-phosphatase [Lapillicoccus sp.]|nr:low molecular weight protein-tyrosine-phosphatase [Lapillicoccus sp.]